MKKISVVHVAAAALGLLLAAAPGRAQTAQASGGSLWIEGDSTLHRWSSTSTAVELSFALAEGASDPVETVKSSKVVSAQARIPAASLKSGEKGLDKNMLKAMNAEKFPDVLFKLGKYEPVKTSTGGVMTTTASGELTISGQTKPATIDVEFAPAPGGMRVRGAYALKMSDFGIAPPKLFLGTIKVRDPVTVRFDLVFINTNKEKMQ